MLYSRREKDEKQVEPELLPDGHRLGSFANHDS